MGRVTTSAEACRIKLLDAHTVNQISAGEVVERPASALKELVENALDAGARRIWVDLAGSGKSLIRVQDDGCGMSEDEVRMALQRHATSKIRQASDLAGVQTMGFRGEALPSIASVARMRLMSAAEPGTRICLEVEGGAMGEITMEPGPQGTVVEVRDLFFNTPARLRFLKSDATELGACVEVVQRAAIARPDVSFRLRHLRSDADEALAKGAILLQTAGDDDRLGAIGDVWGRDTARSLAEMSGVGGGVRVRGYISPPHHTKATRAYQWIFVNGRPIRSRSLAVAIEQAYKALTPERRYPVCVLVIDVDPARVDVNVSPTKSEVKFQAEGIVFDAVRQAIKSALLLHGMVPSADEILAANEALAVTERPAWWQRGSAATLDPAGSQGTAVSGQDRLLTGRDTFLPRPEADSFEPSDCSSFQKFGSALDGSSAPGAAWDADRAGDSMERPPLESRSAYDSLLEGLRVIGQSMDTFILAENHRGVLIVDQHVAHERILFEKIRRSRGGVPVETQPLLVPVPLEMDRRSIEALRENVEEVRGLGFDLEDFGAETMLVRGAPAALRGRSPVAVLREIADEFVEGFGRGDRLSAREQIWITCACKMAVKAGDPLTIAEMEKLMLDLAQTENPYLCPHGRPITMVLDRDALFRKFLRH